MTLKNENKLVNRMMTYQDFCMERNLSLESLLGNRITDFQEISKMSSEKKIDKSDELKYIIFDFSHLKYETDGWSGFIIGKYLQDLTHAASFSNHSVELRMPLITIVPLEFDAHTHFQARPELKLLPDSEFEKLELKDKFRCMDSIEKATSDFIIIKRNSESGPSEKLFRL